MSTAKQQVHSFDAEGMNTLFSIRMHHEDRKQAETLAGNCFLQLESLESELSRYRPDSDISRINNLDTGESMLLNEATYQCLKLALKATAITAGLFDPTLGLQTRKPEIPFNASDNGRFHLSPNRPEITCIQAGRHIDLGGIGKGFALDQMAATLSELEVKSALLSSGASTHLAIGRHRWPFQLRGDAHSLPIHLSNQALSSSGIGEQGAHVIHPDTGESPLYHFKRIWVITPVAALADAFSTACLLMDEAEVRSFTQAHEGTIQVYAESIDTSIIQAY